MTLPIVANTAQLLERFSGGPTVEDRWTAARQLMAVRELMKVVDRPEFQTGFKALGQEAKTGHGIERLLAVELLVRLSNFVKKLKPEASNLLKDALEEQLPLLSLVAETKNLPAGAKPAEIRENVALSLTHASSDWVLHYILRAFAEEDRSRRCRLELARQLASREKSIDRWLEALAEGPQLRSLSENSGVDSAVTKLRDLAKSLAETIRKNRDQLTGSIAAGQALADLSERTVRLSRRAPIPSHLDSAAVEVAGLLDELLTALPGLSAEPKAYAVVEIFRNWWQPLSYPEPLQQALVPIVDKLLGRITSLAREEKRSEELTSRLRQALGDPKEAARMLAQIADRETGLAPEIDDWLHGKKRATSAAVLKRALQSVSSEDIIAAIAPLFLEAEEAVAALEKNSPDETADHLRRLASRIRSLATQRGLKTAGEPGEVVQYVPSVHETLTGTIPREPSVRIVRPMVLRQRQDGGEDILVKALVSES